MHVINLLEMLSLPNSVRPMWRIQTKNYFKRQDKEWKFHKNSYNSQKLFWYLEKSI